MLTLSHPRWTRLACHLLLLSCASVSMAQGRRLDSLQHVLDGHPRKDPERVELLIAVVRQSVLVAPHRQDGRAQEAVDLARALKDNTLVARALIAQAHLHQWQHGSGTETAAVDEAFSLTTDLGGAAEKARALIVKYWDQDEVRAGAGDQRLLHEAMDLARQAGEPLLEAEAERHFAIAAQPSDPERSQQHMDRMFRTLSAYGDPGQRAMALRLAGQMQLMEGEPAKALDLLLQGLASALEDGARIEEAGNLSMASSVYESMGDYPKAIEFATRAIKVDEAVGYDLGVGISESFIGTMLLNMGDAGQALPHFQRAHAIGEHVDHVPLSVSTLVDIAHAELEQGRLQEAIAAAEEAGTASLTSRHRLQEYADELDARSKEVLGKVRSAQGEHAAALALLDSALVIADARHLPDLACSMRGSLAAAILRAPRPDLRRARMLYEEMERSAAAHGWSKMRHTALKGLADVHKRLGEPDKALAYMDAFLAIQDSLLGTRTSIAVANVKGQAEAEKQEALMALEQQRKDLQARTLLDAERRRKRNALAGGVMVSAIALLLAWLLTSSRRNAARLRAKNTEITQAQLRLVEAEKQRENEQVRTRIARDIHDEIGSGLTKIALLGSEAKRRVNDHSDELRAALDRITAHSREVSAALSDIVWSVDPAHDTSAELVEHARTMAQRLLEDSGVPYDLRFHHHGPAHPVAPGTKHQVVMVMKEAINNALKHADAQHITVGLEAGAQAFRLLVTDDGKGFEPEDMAHNGNGLRNMRARAEAIGATCTVQSTPGHGSTIMLEGRTS